MTTTQIAPDRVLPETGAAATQSVHSLPARIAGFTYGLVVYLAFLGVFAGLGVWLSGQLPAFGIDHGGSAPLGVALAVNLGFVLLWSVQHLVMARKGFKQRITRLIPAGVERSTFMLAAVSILAGMMLLWQPLPEVIWSVEAPAAWWTLVGLQVAGWLGVVYTTFLIDHFELFGLKQVWAFLRGSEVREPSFKMPWLYRKVRHPMMTCMLFLFWATPTMTLGHMVLAAAMTKFILIALVFEERDLIARHGFAYRSYRERTPKLLPKLF
ncbi:MAG: isoprenylcysteine carboxylmethyltransferase family protein [Planctomycetota bacterium]